MLTNKSLKFKLIHCDNNKLSLEFDSEIYVFALNFDKTKNFQQFKFELSSYIYNSGTSVFLALKSKVIALRYSVLIMPPDFDKYYVMFAIPALASS